MSYIRAWKAYKELVVILYLNIIEYTFLLLLCAYVELFNPIYLAYLCVPSLC